MAKLKLPFALVKPSPNEYVTQASQIGCNGGSNVQVELDTLDEKSKELSVIVNGGTSESVIEVEKVEGENIFVDKYVNTSAEYASNPIAVEGFATMLIPCKKGDTFLINAPATPPSAAVKLYVVTDDTRKILSSSGTEIPSSRETPVEVTINDESAAFLIVNFAAVYDAESDKVSKDVTIEREGLVSNISELETSINLVQQKLDTLEETSEELVSNISELETSIDSIRQKSDQAYELSNELSVTVNGGTSETIIEVEKVEGETIFVDKYVNTSAEYASHPISVEGFATMLIPCKKGDTFLINAPATPASAAVKLYVITDDTRKILSSSGTEIPSSRETPVEVSINDESAAFLIVNFAAVYDAESDKVSKYEKIESEGLEERVERLESSTETKVFEGKTIVLFGDSINEFGEEGDNVHGWSKRWCDYFEDMTGANIINIAIGGTCIKQRRSPLKTGGGEDATDMYARLDVINMVRACCGNIQWSLLEEAALYLKNNAYDDNTGIVALAKAIEWNKVDAVLLAAGTNDWAFNSNPYDNVPERNTFDAFEIIVENLLTAHPSVKLYYISPYVRYYSTGGESALDMRIPERWSDNYTFGNSGNLKDFNQKLIEKAISMKIPYCDMYNTLGWNRYNFANYFRDTDNTHPFKGFNVIAKKIFAFLRSNQTF